jgi:hypothetical protein
MEINGQLHALNRAPCTQLRLGGPQNCFGCFVEQKTLALLKPSQLARHRPYGEVKVSRTLNTVGLSKLNYIENCSLKPDKINWET